MNISSFYKNETDRKKRRQIWKSLKGRSVKMKKILLSLAAFMIAATSYAFEDFKIDIESISVNQTSKTKVAKPEVEQKSFFVKKKYYHV